MNDSRNVPLMGDLDTVYIFIFLYYIFIFHSFMAEVKQFTKI
jgi:hypothetical protein